MKMKYFSSPSTLPSPYTSECFVQSQSLKKINHRIERILSLWNLAGDLVLICLRFILNFELINNSNHSLFSGLGTRHTKIFEIWSSVTFLTLYSSRPFTIELQPYRTLRSILSGTCVFAHSHLCAQALSCLASFITSPWSLTVRPLFFLFSLTSRVCKRIYPILSLSLPVCFPHTNVSPLRERTLSHFCSPVLGRQLCERMVGWMDG